MSSNAAPPSVVDDAAAPPDRPSATLLDRPGNESDAASAGRRSANELVELDPAAIDLARVAAVAEAGIADHVGDFLAAVAEDDIAVTASFVARQAGYVGWHWSVTLAVLDQEPATVSEVVLLPGEGALLAPTWIPWDQRIRPGDVGVGDLLPPIENDPRLVPAYLQSDDPAVEAVAQELGIGRVHVLSREGRLDFAERLHDGTFGPAGEIALAAPAQCFTCAFFLPLAGSLGQLVGACGNEYSPADGRVVDAEFGCGAHSETVIEMPARSAATLAVIDELALEVHRRPAPAAVVEAVEAVGTGEDAAGDLDLVEIDVVEIDVAEIDGVDIVDTDIAEPGIEPEVLEAEVAEPEVVEAEVTEVQVLQPELVEAEVTAAQVVGPEVVDPEVTEPEVVEPEPVDGAETPVPAADDSTSQD